VIPRLILERNLYGLDIDDRASQLASFAVIMKARADDRRLFSEPVSLNILAFKDSKGIEASDIASRLARFGVDRGLTILLVAAFENAKTFGSLIQLAPSLRSRLPELEVALRTAFADGDLYERAAAQDMLDLLPQAKILASTFDVVIANPPYMGSKFLTSTLKSFLNSQYSGFEKDLFSAFIARNLMFAKASGKLGFMSPFVWMFISSYEDLRRHVLAEATLTSLVQLEYSGFDGATVPICTFTIDRSHLTDYVGTYLRLVDFKGSDQQAPRTIQALKDRSCGWIHEAKPERFADIPGSPIAYWISDDLRKAFGVNPSIASFASTRKGMATGDNARFVRAWWEVSHRKIGFGMSREEATASTMRWFPYANGGDFRKWFGNIEDVVLWERDGEVLQSELHETGRLRAVNLNLDYIFKQGLTWTSITSSFFSARMMPAGCLFSSAANSLFTTPDNILPLLGELNSNVFGYISKVVNPTLNMNPGDTGKIPFPGDESIKVVVSKVVESLIEIEREDWNCSERSWDFARFPWLPPAGADSTLSESWRAWEERKVAALRDCQHLEERNNAIFINAFGLSGELSPAAVEEQLTLGRANRERDSQSLVSYVVGCAMGRYSLDAPGLAFASEGDAGFDPAKYLRFSADADGIVPVTDELWFPDDMAGRLREFLAAAWGSSALDENMAWLADGLGRKGSETPEESIRRYMSDKYYKDHVQAYKKRPIYWLFSSGRQGAFKALVYLHRYNENTLARLRSEYVVSLAAKIHVAGLLCWSARSGLRPLTGSARQAAAADRRAAEEAVGAVCL
jgi:hypothetical protein